MTHEIRVVFENDVFRPIDPPIDLEQGEYIVVIRSDGTPCASISPSQEADELQKQREALRELFAQAELLPLEVSGDGVVSSLPLS